MFFWNSCFFDDQTDVDNLISGSSTFSKSSLNIWKFSVHVMLKHRFENFEHYFVRVWASLVAQTVKHLPAKGETWSIPGLGRSPGEGNGNPLQCSCLENPRDGGAWWATIYGVAQGWTRLKRLSISSSSTR